MTDSDKLIEYFSDKCAIGDNVAYWPKVGDLDPVYKHGCRTFTTSEAFIHKGAAVVRVDGIDGFVPLTNIEIQDPCEVDSDYHDGCWADGFSHTWALPKDL